MLKDLESIVRKLEESQLILERTLNQLPAERATQLMVTPEWSVKDVVAHLAGAERGMTRLAQRFAAGENPQLPEDYDNDVYNARQVAKRQAMSVTEVRADFVAARKDLYVFLEGVTAEQLGLCGEHPLAGQLSLKDLLVVIYSHQVTHCQEINAKIHES